MDAALIHNHYCLSDTRLLGLLPSAEQRNVGVINGSPFGSGLLTDRGPATWHPGTPQDRCVFKAAAEFCRNAGTSISRLAIQFATQNPAVPTTLFSSANPRSVIDNIRWSEEPCDEALLRGVQSILQPVRDKEWNYNLMSAVKIDAHHHLWRTRAPRFIASSLCEQFSPIRR